MINKIGKEEEKIDESTELSWERGFKHLIKDDLAI